MSHNWVKALTFSFYRQMAAAEEEEPNIKLFSVCVLLLIALQKKTEQQPASLVLKPHDSPTPRCSLPPIRMAKKK